MELITTAIIVPLLGMVGWMVKYFIGSLEKVQNRSEEKDDKFIATLDGFKDGLETQVKETMAMGMKAVKVASTEHVELKEGQELIVTTVMAVQDDVKEVHNDVKELKKKINTRV